VYKDPSVRGLAFRIHGLVKKFENLLVVKRAARLKDRYGKTERWGVNGSR
jgi:hypothetical protein